MFLENDIDKEEANINYVCSFNNPNSLQELETRHRRTQNLIHLNAWTNIIQ